MIAIDRLSSTCTWHEDESESWFDVTICGESDAEWVTVELQAIDCNPTASFSSLVQVEDGAWEKPFVIPPPDLGRIRVRAWVSDGDRDPPKNGQGIVGYYLAAMSAQGLIGFDEPPLYWPVW